VPVEPASPLESLTEALVGTTDQLLAMYDIASLHTDTLDEGESVDHLLAKAQILLRADALRWDPGSGPGAESAVEGVEGVEGVDAAPLLDTAEVNAAGRTVTAVEVVDPDGGTATLTARRLATPFTTGDTKLLSAIAHLAMSAQHTARLHAEAVAQAVVAHEHTLASQLAQRALPVTEGPGRPTVPGVDWFARTEPARLAGGDLFAFKLIDTTFHFAVGDVSGKGLPAAIMMSNIINSVQASFEQHGADGPIAVFEGTEHFMHDPLSNANMFVTLLVGTYDTERHLLSLVNAGHSPVHFVRDHVVKPVPASHPPIGVIAGMPCVQLEFHVQPGDRFVAASDGFPEQTDDTGAMFGDDRFTKALADPAGARDFGRGLFDTIHRFAGAVPQSDDLTLFILDFGASSMSELKVASNYEALRAIGPWLDGILEPFDETTRTIMQQRMELAMQELATNSIDHAESGEGGLTLRSDVNSTSVVIELSDLGKPVDIATIPEPDLAEPQIGGYGMMIAEQLTDDLGYERVDRRNVWTVRFDLPQT
jgi:serine phosphatase RsbU (regulator of sigma subunit)/anti-sigma regulatory factor (Ser/Thr protein kinase)